MYQRSIDLGNGAVTNGRKPLSVITQQADLVFKDGISGKKSVLDIGAWDGAFSFEAERRGASDVLATDWWCWVGPGWGRKGAFEFARRQLGARVRDLTADILELDVNKIGAFDVVLLLGVIYHVKNPLQILEHVAQFVKGSLVLETLILNRFDPKPVAEFFAEGFAGDGSNWWAPNQSCMRDLLKAAGFRRVEVTVHATDREYTRGVFHAYPFIDRDLAGEDGRAVPVALFKDLVEIAAGAGIERIETPIVENEELGAVEAAHDAGVAPITARQREIGKQLGNPLIEHRSIVAAGLLAESTGKPTFADSGRSGAILPGFRR
jgi:tRNA (mo5U34)-methyltransferase